MVAEFNFHVYFTVQNISLWLSMNRVKTCEHVTLTKKIEGGYFYKPS